MANLPDVVAGSTSLESQWTRSVASAPPENVLNAVDMHIKCGLAMEKKVIGPAHIGIHPANRAGTGVDPFDAHKLLVKIMGQGFSCEGLSKSSGDHSRAAVSPRRSMYEHRRVLAEAANVQGFWSKEKCKEIIEAASALPLGGLTPSENLTYIKALDEYDTPELFRLLFESFDAADPVTFASREQTYNATST